MSYRFIIQPPLALLLGVEALGTPSEDGGTIIYGIALHFLLFSLEIDWA